MPLDNKEGGNQNYDLLLDISLTFFQFFLRPGRGWESKFLFRIDRAINRMEIVCERVILDHQIYAMKENLIQTVVRNMNNF